MKRIFWITLSSFLFHLPCAAQDVYPDTIFQSRDQNFKIRYDTVTCLIISASKNGVVYYKKGSSDRHYAQAFMLDGYKWNSKNWDKVKFSNAVAQAKSLDGLYSSKAKQPVAQSKKPATPVPAKPALSQKKYDDYFIKKNGDTVRCNITKTDNKNIVYTRNNISATIPVQEVIHLYKDKLEKTKKTTLRYTRALEAGAYDFSNYQSMSSAGIVPNDLIKFYSKEHEYRGAGQKGSSSKEFITENKLSFGVLYSSGKVLFGDPMSLYTKMVLDTLLFKHRDIRNKIRIFTLKSSVPNAFTTNDGKIFVTVGLLARLQNEAQLAYILSHEIAHYLERHSYESYTFNINIKRKLKYMSLSKERFNSILSSKYKHSKKNELEADSIGLNYFAGSLYASTEAISAFDVLKYSDQPITDTVFNKSFFENKFYWMPISIWNDTSLSGGKEIDENDDDSRSTHPNIKTRKEKLANKKNTRNASSLKFVHSESKFEFIKKISRFELCNILLQESQYDECIYTCYYLLSKYPDNIYLEKTLAKALCAKANNFSTRPNDTILSAITGENYRKFVSAFNNLPEQDFGIIANMYLWDLHKKYPHDVEIQILTNHLPYTEKQSKSKDFLSSVQIDSIFKGQLRLENMDAESISSLSYDGFLQQLKNYGKKVFFARQLNDKNFYNSFFRLSDGYTSDNGQLDFSDRSMLVVPTIFQIDTTFSTEKVTIGHSLYSAYEKRILDFGKKKGVDYTPLSTYALDSLSLDRYNDYCTIKEILPMIMYDGNKNGKYVYYDELKALCDKYKSRYICLSNVYVCKNPFGQKLGAFLISGLAFPGFGFIPGFYILATDNHTPYYETIIYDIQTNAVYKQEIHYPGIGTIRPKVRARGLWKTTKHLF